MGVPEAGVSEAEVIEAMIERLRSDLRDTLRGWVAEAIEQELSRE